jgi:hypothetical protein
MKRQNRPRVYSKKLYHVSKYSQKLYDNILKVKNDQIVSDPQKIKDTMTAYFQ